MPNASEVPAESSSRSQAEDVRAQAAQATGGDNGIEGRARRLRLDPDDDASAPESRQRIVGDEPSAGPIVRRSIRAEGISQVAPQTAIRPYAPQTEGSSSSVGSQAEENLKRLASAIRTAIGEVQEQISEGEAFLRGNPLSELATRHRNEHQELLSRLESHRSDLQAVNGGLDNLANLADQGPGAVNGIMEPLVSIGRRFQRYAPPTSPAIENLPGFGTVADLNDLIGTITIDRSDLPAGLQGTDRPQGVQSDAPTLAPAQGAQESTGSAPQGAGETPRGTGQSRPSGVELLASTEIVRQLMENAIATRREVPRDTAGAALQIIKNVAKIAVPEFGKVAVAFWAANFLDSAITPHIREMKPEDQKKITDFFNAMGIVLQTASVIMPTAQAIRQLLQHRAPDAGLNKAQLAGHAGMIATSLASTIISAKIGDPASVASQAVRTQFLLLFRAIGSLPFTTEINRNSNNKDGIPTALTPAIPYGALYTLANEFVGLPHSYTGGSVATAMNSSAENALYTLPPSILYAFAEASYPTLVFLHRQISDRHAPDPARRPGRSDNPNLLEHDSKLDRVLMNVSNTQVRIRPRIPSQEEFLSTFSSWGATSNFYMAAFNLQPIFNKVLLNEKVEPSTLAAYIKSNSPANPESAWMFGAISVFFMMTAMENPTDAWKFNPRGPED